MTVPTPPTTAMPEPADQGEQAAVAAFFAAAEAVNLDETVPEPITVTLKVYVEVPATTAEGRKRRKLSTRTTQIETYIPLDIYDAMLLSRARLMTQLAHTSDDAKPGLQLAWMAEQVLRVWQLTEPDTTAEELKLGLSLEETQALFGRFFGALSRQGTSSPASGAPPSPTPVPDSTPEPTAAVAAAAAAPIARE